MYATRNEPGTPTDEERHQRLQNALFQVGRLEDYEYIMHFLSPPPDITTFAPLGDLKGMKIGIMGGGLAGLCAAYELRKLGADITILEALEDRIGGKVYTHYFSEEHYGEMGALRFPISHETSWHYINLFELNTISRTGVGSDNFLYVHNWRLRASDSIEENLYPLYPLTPQERNMTWSELTGYAFHYLLQRLSPQVRSEFIQILPNYSSDYLSLANKSVRQTLESLGLSQGAIRLISSVIPGAGAKINLSYDEYISTDYTLDYQNTYRIEGGNVNLPLAFYQSFLSNYPKQYSHIPSTQLGHVEYKAGHCVTGIYESNYRNKIILKYKNRKNKKEAADIFDYVICAIPFSCLRTVDIKPYFSDLKMQAILEYNYVDSQKTQLLCNRRFWERDADYGRINGGTSFTDLPIQSIFYPTDHLQCLEDGTCSSEEPGVLLASYNVLQNAIRVGGLNTKKRLKLIQSNVEEVHGLPKGFLSPMIEDYKSVHWNEEPTFRGAFALATPGQKPLFLYEMLQPEFHHRVYFAGDHVSAKTGWIQGALYSGKAAANNLAKFHHMQQSQSQ